VACPHPLFVHHLKPLSRAGSVEYCDIDLFVDFCSVSLGLLYIFGVISPGFCLPVSFLSTSQEIGWEEHLRNDLLCIEWDVKP